MTELVQFSLGNGRSVVAEVDPPGEETFSWTRAPREREGSAPVGRRGNGSTLGQELDSRLDQVRDAAATVLRLFKDAASPDEIKVSLGVKLSQEAGAVIARTAMEGNLAVELLWKRSTDGTS
jgi:hypothetical protein